MELYINLACIITSILMVIVLSSVLKLNAFISLFVSSLFLAICLIPLKEIPTVLTLGFGNTMKSIGLIIIFGAAIGIVLDKTKATTSLAQAILKRTGDKNASLAIGFTGYFTGLSIFCDSGFIVLSSLTRSMAKKAAKSAVLLSILLAISLYSVHCIIPPHPGATAAAAAMNVPFGTIIFFGIIITIPAVIITWILIGIFFGKKIQEVSLLEEVATQNETNLPSPILSLLPISIPLLLIISASIIELQHISIPFLSFLGHPVIALFVGFLLSLLLIKGNITKTLNELLGETMEKAGSILIITASGGVFGYVIKETGIGLEIGKLLQTSNLGILIPFLIAMTLKTAQGSSTVAIITAASIVAPLLGPLELDSTNGRLIATLAMGAGSILISHANDSYFWVVSKFSDIDIKTMLRVYTLSSIILAMVTLFFIYILSFILL